jgi:hypothetical protein
MGGIQHIQAILQLLECAYEDNKNEKFYCHVLTGQDCLCRTKQELFDFFSEDSFKNYMSCSESKDNNFRYRTFYRNDWINYKSKIGKFLTKCGYILQRMVGINRKPPFGYKVFKGMVYVSITNEFVDYILEYLKTPEGKKYFKWIKWCFVPEEFFFQTIAMNSKYASTVEKNNYRYALWKEKHGSQPGILDEVDYSDIIDSNAFFARKMNLEYSKELLKRLCCIGLFIISQFHMLLWRV